MINTNLPTQLTSFVGRDEERKTINKWLGAPSCRLITLLGPGGIGKTRLALAVAEDQIDQYRDGVFVISLGSMAQQRNIPQLIASMIEFEFYQSSAHSDKTLYQFLSHKKTLLVLDDFEYHGAGAKFISKLLKGTKELKLLVTSREPLNISGEWRLMVAGLGIPPTKSNDLIRYGASQLFIARASQANSNFDPNSHQDSIIELCRLLGGMPLAIELAAAWVHAMSPKSILDELTDSLDILETGLIDVLDRHRSLRAVLNPSWQKLTSEEKKVLRALSVFKSNFSKEAAEKVTGASQNTIFALLQKSFIQSTDASRLVMHPLIRRYAEEKLEASEQALKVAHSHALYYADLVEKIAPHTWEADVYQPNNLDLLDLEFENLRSVIEWSFEHDEGWISARIVAAGHIYLNDRGHHIEGLEWAERVLANQENRSMDTLSQVLLAASSFAETQSLNDKAKEYAENAFQLANANDKPLIAGWACYRLGSIALFADSDYAVAKTQFENALSFFKQLQSDHMETVILNSLGEVARAQGNMTKAERLLRESLTKGVELGMSPAMRALNLAEVLIELGRENQGIRYLSKSLDYAQVLGSPLWISQSILSIVKLLTERGRINEASELLGYCKNTFNTIGYSNPITDRSINKIHSAIKKQEGASSHESQWPKEKSITQTEAINLAATALSRLKNLEPTETIMEANRLLPEPLTPRELDVLNLIVAGKPNKGIANALSISENTVKTHVKNIYQKLDVHNRAEAIARAEEFGLK